MVDLGGTRLLRANDSMLRQVSAGLSFPIFPIPPFEQFGVVYGVVRVVDGTAENLEYAAVDLNLSLPAVFVV